MYGWREETPNPISIPTYPTGREIPFKAQIGSKSIWLHIDL